MYVPFLECDRYLLGLSERVKVPLLHAGTEPYLWERIFLLRLRKDSRVERLARFGSAIRLTSVSGYSDSDIMMLLAGPRPTDPREALGIAHEAVIRASNHTMEVLADSPSLTIINPLSYSNLDIVPGYTTHPSHGFMIANPDATGWYLTFPTVHQRFIEEAMPYERRIRDIVRLIKLWNFSTGAKIASIYIELFVAQAVRIVNYDSTLGMLIELMDEVRRTRYKDVQLPAIEEDVRVSALTPNFDIARANSLIDNFIEIGHAADALERSRDPEAARRKLAEAFLTDHDKSRHQASTNINNLSAGDSFLMQFEYDPLRGKHTDQFIHPSARRFR